MKLHIEIDTEVQPSERDIAVLRALTGDPNGFISGGKLVVTEGQHAIIRGVHLAGTPIEHDTQDAAAERAADPTFEPGAVRSSTMRAIEEMDDGSGVVIGDVALPAGSEQMGQAVNTLDEPQRNVTDPWDAPPPPAPTPPAEGEKPKRKRRTKAEMEAARAAEAAQPAPAQPSTPAQEAATPAIGAPIAPGTISADGHWVMTAAGAREIPPGLFFNGFDPAGEPIFVTATSVGPAPAFPPPMWGTETSDDDTAVDGDAQTATIDTPLISKPF